MQPMLRRSLPLLLVLLLGGRIICAADAHLVPTPRASLMPASPTNRPFLAADHALAPVDLVASGYVESELAVSGFANVYEWAARGASEAVAVRGANVPYTTRILVRRPKDAAKFSGRVIVELLDPTGLHDSAPLWGLSWDHFLKRGDAWVGVTVKPAAVATLRRFDAVRYASLSFAYRRSGACAAAPSATDLPDAESGLAWDVIAQVGALLKSSSKENPLLQLNPQRVLAAGYSEAGGYITTYANAVHDGLRLGDGSPVFDGYLTAAGANAAPIHQCAAPLADDDIRRLAPKMDVPFVTVMNGPDVLAAQPGSVSAGLPDAADLTIAGYAASAADPCREPRGDLPPGYTFNAIWQQYEDLLVKQIPMAIEPRIEVDAAGQVLRDGLANARAQGACPQAGSQKLDASHLKARYRTRAEFLSRFNLAVDEFARERRLTPEDALALKATGARATPAF
jgi:Alpha/beta hydrolase domain